LGGKRYLARLNVLGQRRRDLSLYGGRLLREGIPLRQGIGDTEDRYPFIGA
jgi:hypothetical protein